MIKWKPNNFISREEFDEYKKMNKKLMKNNPFVEMEDTPEWKRLNQLTIKIQKLNYDNIQQQPGVQR